MAGQGLTVEFSEFVGHSAESPNEAFEPDGSRATRILDIHDWAERVQAVWEILGYSYIEGTSTDTKLLRYLPERHPDYPWLVATHISRMQGIGKASAVDTDYGKMADYADGCRIWVEYSFTTYDVKKDEDVTKEYQRYVSHTARQSGEFFSFTTGVGQKPLKWAEGADVNKNYPFARSKIITTVDHEFTWHQIPYLGVPYTTLKGAYGKINKTSITLDGQDFAAHTLQLVGVDYRRIMAPFSDVADPELGDIYYDLVYTFKEKPTTFTKSFNPNTGLFQKLSFNGTSFTVGSMADGVTPFDEMEFADLFVIRQQ